MTKWVEAVMIAGTVVGFLMEFVKTWWRKGTEKPVPTWMGMSLASCFSVLVSLAVYFGWLVPCNMWMFPVLAVAVFLFQYFVSMEILKRIVKSVMEKAGVDLGKDD